MVSRTVIYKHIQTLKDELNSKPEWNFGTISQLRLNPAANVANALVCYNSMLVASHSNTFASINNSRRFESLD